ncbi:cobyric acid synthase [Granulicella tundricola]|uniref:Cobyric acid synthase n=1 Tax=Granulicella tundricola (strain ATCC BAA-1859 / DSM 23138 / MP5ACTX9) TaxID=1198114 RepID=E8X1D4_GRATM|nr:cobyric acid synthase [Granulicella tundricola]ADW69088.1 cobyric acid synthase CobQ [Granulicella tundricola MP5ACTX9]
MRARAIMVLGTASHVGKSLLVAALCRIFAQHGVRVAPFKSQNMSLNSAATPEGLEIGRAQALQAEAAGIPPSVHMNPILLKPSGNMTSQVIVHGRIHGQFTAADYHRRRVEELFPIVTESYEHLAAEYDLIILEGAGSPAEINLKAHDIVNMRMADLADAHCILVGDIDRGGVFASLLGTIELLEPHEQARIQGFVVNKFRGDVALLEPGLRMIEARIHKPSLGVIPHYPNLALDEEDSLGLQQIATTPWAQSADPARPLRIAVIALPSLSNFTDFDSLTSEPSVDLRLIRTVETLANTDLVILPGSKQTVADLAWLNETGLAAAIQAHAATSLVVGICGGMQMLGRTISDPGHIESDSDAPIEGLSLLPIETTMQPHKTTVLSRGALLPTTLFNHPCPPTELTGYEIHIGTTTYLPNSHPFVRLNDVVILSEAQNLSILPGSPSPQPEPTPDGAIDPTTRIFGTYLHGLFDEDPFRHLFLTNARAFHHLTPPAALNNWKHHRESALNAFAAHVESSLDMPQIFSWAGLDYQALDKKS